MKILHLSDLHIGKRLYEYSMLEQQKYILDDIIKITESENIDCVVIAGDVYDKSVPSTDSVQLFDRFVCSLNMKKIPVLIISGNHDSPERLSFGSGIMASAGVHIAPVYSGKVKSVVLSDEHGEINFYMLPFVKPAQVRRYFPDREIMTYTDAVKAILDSIEIDTEKRNVLVTHQFVTGSCLSQSEEFAVGGTENIDGSLFEAFDYVALGHIHRPQTMYGGKIRYCGSQLKYHADEVSQEKTYTITEIKEKGTLEIRELPVCPEKKVVAYKGKYDEISDSTFYKNINTDDYIFITLTDEEDIVDAMRKLKKIYPNLLRIFYDNSRTRSVSAVRSETISSKLLPKDIFSAFYETQCSHEMTEEQQEFMKNMIKSVWEEDLS